MVAALYVVAAPATARAQPVATPKPELSVTPRAQHLELSWSDAEDTVTGGLTPATPRSDQPIRLTLKVGSFEGAPFEGPVRVSLRRSEERVAQEKVLPFTGHGWSTEFHVEEGGAYELDVGFQTTRSKTVRAQFDVIHVSAIPRALKWSALAAVIAVALVIGIRRVRHWPRVGPDTTSR